MGKRDPRGNKLLQALRSDPYFSVKNRIYLLKKVFFLLKHGSLLRVWRGPVPLNPLGNVTDYKYTK